MTFEDLTSLYRMEKKSTALAEARKDLYAAISRLLTDIQKEYEKQLVSDPDSIITDGLNERRKKMMDFSQRIVDLRMNKILILALRGAMGSENQLERLTAEERDFYQSVLEHCRSHRALISSPRKKREVRIPDILGEESAAQVQKDEPAKPVLQPADGPLESTLQESMAAEEERSDDVVIRIIEDLPTFSGADRDYNLRKEDVVRMPRVLAMALVNRGKARMVDVRP